MEYTDIKKLPGIFLSVDFEKAFDTIEWNFISNTLEVFKFLLQFPKMDICSLQQYTKRCYEWWTYD